jgi:hypothetical protein
MPKQLTNEIIHAAIDGYEVQKTRLDAKIAELRAMLDGGPAKASAATPQPPTGKRKKFSAAARRHMKEAQQLRWSKSRGESEPPAPTPEAPKPKRKLSEAGRKAISEATKKRWAAVHAAKAAPVVAKKGPAKKASAKKAPVKAAKKAAPAKKSAGKKSAPKKTAPVPTRAATETAAQ